MHSSGLRYPGRVLAGNLDLRWFASVKRITPMSTPISRAMYRAGVCAAWRADHVTIHVTIHIPIADDALSTGAVAFGYGRPTAWRAALGPNTRTALS